MKTGLALIDGFADCDEGRLTELLGSAYVPFTDTEKTALAKVPAVIISREWFMDYDYALNTESGEKTTEFYNPTTLENNHFLHAWKVFSTSPFENAVVFEQDDIAVSSVAINPSSATVSKGQSLDFTATVTTTGFANKGVFYSINKEAEDEGATINNSGKLFVPKNYDNTKSGTAGVYTFEIKTALATSDTIKLGSTTYTVSAEDNTAVKQATALVTALGTLADYTVTRDSATLTFTEKSGHYNSGAPELVVTTTTGVTEEKTTTTPVLPTTPILVTATSVYDKTKSATATITVS